MMVKRVLRVLRNVALSQTVNSAAESKIASSSQLCMLRLQAWLLTFTTQCILSLIRLPLFSATILRPSKWITKTWLIQTTQKETPKTNLSLRIPPKDLEISEEGVWITA